MNLPEKERNESIYNRIITSRNSFLSYVSFMLADNYGEAILEQKEFLNMLNNGYIKTQSIPSTLYEKLLRAFCF